MGVGFKLCVVILSVFLFDEGLRISWNVCLKVSDEKNNIFYWLN